MKTRLVKIDRSAIVLDPARIMELLGTPAGDKFTLDMAADYIYRCTEMAEPCGGYIIAKAGESVSKESISVDGRRLETGKIVRNLLGKAEEFAFFIATAGPRPENLSRKLIGEGKFLEGYLADLVGSGIVESVTDQVHRQVKEYAARKEMKITNRYNPGYCTWSVEEQQKLFALFNGGICGVTLSSSSLMTPMKSVSGVIGIGREVVFNNNNCEICTRKECHFRNAHH